MNAYPVEVITGVVLLGLFLIVLLWQRNRKLTHAEVENYVRILERDLPTDFEDRAEYIVRLRAWGESDDGKRLFTVNVMRFFDELRQVPGAPKTGTPREVNALDEKACARPMLKPGGFPVVAGNATKIWSDQKQSNLFEYKPALDGWDRIAVVSWPGRRAFLDFVTHPDYVKVMAYKLASLEVIFTPISVDMEIPDLRLLAGNLGVIVFLLVAWISALHRAT